MLHVRTFVLDACILQHDINNRLFKREPGTSASVYRWVTDGLRAHDVKVENEKEEANLHGSSLMFILIANGLAQLIIFDGVMSYYDDDSSEEDLFYHNYSVDYAN